MKQVFEHQIDQIVAYLSWAQEWVEDGVVEDRGATGLDAYTRGGAEALGHLLACWFVQVGGLMDCETAIGRDILFDDRGERHTAAFVKRSICTMLTDGGVEVIHG